MGIDWNKYNNLMEKAGADFINAGPDSDGIEDAKNLLTIVAQLLTDAVESNLSEKDTVDLVYASIPFAILIGQRYEGE